MPCCIITSRLLRRRILMQQSNALAWAGRLSTCTDMYSILQYIHSEFNQFQKCEVHGGPCAHPWIELQRIWYIQVSEEFAQSQNSSSESHHVIQQKLLQHSHSDCHGPGIVCRDAPCIRLKYRKAFCESLASTHVADSYLSHRTCRHRK